MTAFPIHLAGLVPFRSSRRGHGQHPRITPGSLSAQQPDILPLVPTRTDEQLIADYVAGDRDALRVVIERYRNEVLHFLIRFLGQRAAADDVFQETFVQVHQSAGTFDPERRFRPWLFTIAANKARDYHRKHTRQTPMSLSATIGGDSEGASFVDLLRSEMPTPDLPVLDAERSRLVRSVVDSMPSHLREILMLSYFHKLSYNQIADTLSIPLGTVKSRLHTAVASFAHAWKAAMVQGRNEP
jgi:RNA polymerase sigma-70 factor (ECF subfamily)